MVGVPSRVATSSAHDLALICYESDHADSENSDIEIAYTIRQRVSNCLTPRRRDELPA